MADTSVNTGDSLRLSVSLPAGLIEAALNALEDAGISDYVLWQLEDSQDGTVSFYGETMEEMQSLRGLVKAAFDAGGIGQGYEFTEDRISANDWENSWKRYFHAERLSDHIVVRPSWEEWQGKDGDIEVVIDPGMSFGTGLHQTTRACIRFIDGLSGAGGSMLDAGCGSGILSIAAVKLGYEPVLAIDNDPVAVECAAKNFSVNGVEDLIGVECIPLGELVNRKPFDVVVVNILAHVIESNAGHIVSLLKPATGRLVLAGILNTQFDGIAACFAGYGLRLIERIDDGEWSSGRFEP